MIFLYDSLPKAFIKIVIFVKGVFCGRASVHSGRESRGQLLGVARLLAAIWPLTKPALLHSRRDPLRPGASHSPLLSRQFCCPVLKCLSVSQDGAGCDLKCQNSVFLTMDVFYLFSVPMCSECPGTCFKVKPLLVSERNPILSFPRNVQLGSVLSSH